MICGWGDKCIQCGESHDVKYWLVTKGRKVMRGRR